MRAITFLLIALPLFGQSPEPPGILFLFADDLRPDCVGFAGNRAVHTPHLDALAARGTAFDQAYCMGSHHGAVCAPSRAMLMTGKTLFRVRDDMRGTELLPEHLRRAGFTTSMTGKWHTGARALRRGFHQGHNVLLSGMSDHTMVPLRTLPAGDGPLTKPAVGPGFSSTIFADTTIRYLEEEAAASPRPFLIYSAFTAPHDPRQPPERWRAVYRAQRPELPTNFLPQHPFDIGDLTVRDEKLLPWPRPVEPLRDQIGEYYGLISHLDEQIGRILGALERTGLADRTYVVFAADHGLSMGSHGLLGKQSLYEHSMGTPVVLAGPGIARGVRRDAPIYLFDLFPTLFDLCQVPLPEGLDGRSLRPVLEDPRARVRDEVFLTYAKSQRALRQGDWKLIRYPRIDKTVLCHLGEDPEEMHDLSALPEHAARIDSMLAALERAQKAAGDELPLTADKLIPAAIDLTGRERTPDRWQPDWIREKYFDLK